MAVIFSILKPCRVGSFTALQTHSFVVHVGQKGSKSILNEMVTSKRGYEEVVTKEGGRKRNAVCKD